MRFSKKNLLSLLREGKAEEFNTLTDKWRKDKKRGFIDLSYADLNHHTFAGFNFSRCDITGCNFEGAVFDHCIMHRVKGIRQAVFVGSYFRTKRDEIGIREKAAIFFALFGKG